jgi:hypothetical protein
MAEAMHLPYEYVDLLRHPGLGCSAGNVALDAYMCQTASNGGNDSAKSLLGSLRWKKDGGTGPSLNSLVGSTEMDLALKGQGTHGTFATIWNFMCRNKEMLKTVKVQARGRRKSNGELGTLLREGPVWDLYFKGRSDKAALEAMIDDRFFGIDCIGFTANYLRWVGEWDKYKGATPTQWAQWHCTQPVTKAADVKPLDFLIWDGHIAIVDWVWSLHGTDMVQVDVCQSSAGGPQCNEYVYLRELKVGGKPMFKVEHVGTPSMPVNGLCRIYRRKGFFW